MASSTGYPSSSHKLYGKDETSITIMWWSDSNIDTVWYNTNGGVDGWWSEAIPANGKTGKYTITGLDANKKYKIVTSLQREGTNLWTNSSPLEISTYDYPHCISAPDFVIGETVTLEFYNPLKRVFDFLITVNNNFVFSHSISGTTYTGLNDEETVDSLYGEISNAQSANYYVDTIYGDIDVPTKVGRYEINEEECIPTFTNFTYKDSNSAVTQITGNDQVMVQGLSTLEVEISVANKMITKNRATPNCYSATFDAIGVSKKESHNKAVVIPLGVVPSDGTKRLSVRAIDSRWCSAFVYKDVTVCPYKNPVVNVSVSRQNNFENLTTLSVSGAYSPVLLSGAEKNGLISLIYRYWEVGKTEITTGGFNFTAGNGEFSCEDTFLDLDNSKAYEFEIEIIDKFNQATKVSATVDVGQAIFFISTNKKTCYINGEEIATKNFVGDAISALFPAGSSMLTAIYPVGAVICMSTNTNPKEFYGGTWELIDKGFSSLHKSDDVFFTATENAISKGTYIERGGHSLHVKQDLELFFSAEDDGMSLGYFDWSSMGITKLPLSINEAMSYSDGSNGGIVYTIVADTGELKQVDVFDCTQTTGSQAFHLSFTMTISKEYMKDNACDKFYFKRTA